ncbi:hypothetical protein Vadar_028026 [Vaccinium darrowii]|uniref:Uncharacterized protein n=1 Tax=Vaccinium darrowii TaxID=229202 RepID=A0ACB7ZM32_9ERIC|nr:hypothetical protein Vadar_028026 [Vaccinium darrowii]
MEKREGDHPQPLSSMEEEPRGEERRGEERRGEREVGEDGGLRGRRKEESREEGWRNRGGEGEGGGGEWWNSSIMEIERQALVDGHGPNVSNAYTINGLLGDLYNCSSDGTYMLKVVPGETYLLRIINAALNNQLFFKIANHTMTVVAVDATYTDPMLTDVVVITPGQSVDVLLTADQPLASYYMAAHAYDSLGLAYDETITTGIIMYENATISTPLMPTLPASNDTSLAFYFYSTLTSLVNGPYWAPVPLEVDKHMFVTVGLGLTPCEGNDTCGAPLGLAYAACMNNQSFELPTKLSMLEASFYNLTTGIYTTDFPSDPSVVFDFTNTNWSNVLNKSLIMTPRSTRVTKLKFNTTVQIVLQNTALVGRENHPIHLHGYNFYVLAQGFGNYDPLTDPTMFNLVNPQKRNTLGVPVGGWAVIRFTANNPGVWLMHCHFDTHITWGLATAFVVEDGPTLETSLPPPPPDLPLCSNIPFSPYLTRRLGLEVYLLLAINIVMLDELLLLVKFTLRLCGPNLPAICANLALSLHISRLPLEFLENTPHNYRVQKI